MKRPLAAFALFLALPFAAANAGPGNGTPYSQDSVVAASIALHCYNRNTPGCW